MGLTNGRRDHDGWTEYLAAPGRKLTLEEFRALEAAHQHALLEQIACALGVFEPEAEKHGGSYLRRLAVAVGMVPGETGGYVEQWRNLLDRFVGHLTTPRPQPDRPAVNGAARMHLVPPQGEPDERR